MTHTHQETTNKSATQFSAYPRVVAGKRSRRIYAALSRLKSLRSQLLSEYVRAQAIADGVLVDLTEWARETGFKYPVACTAAVWHGYIIPPPGTHELGQSDRGRAHDVLCMLHTCIRGIPREAAAASGNDLLFFDVIFLMRPDEHRTVRLKSICGPGDDAEPVITILLPHED